ncbi:S1 RNA-binding domain-containing protein [Pleionea sp. CnH1-48]|uniref:CvfB family protein n=1 Tax=Pleionea sp. CnH1-48 TaxID=2954494 RepID=UPI002097C5F7|nr:S1-like domain-containing RNA-binding protein [Pleionea sp. CnH1-48]MCO7223122.1 S1-like domain-containing RNA-binding protein [Pleionea sp. CnH1-48]
MLKLGRLNRLKVIKPMPFGLYLDGKDYGEIVLPAHLAPKDCEPGQEIEVFVYQNVDNEVVATTKKPLAYVGEFAALTVESVTSVGAFLNWGVPKDILLPFKEQIAPVKEGQKCLVYIHENARDKRVVATAKIEKHLKEEPPRYKTGDSVDLIIANQTDLGIKAIVDNCCWGVIHKQDLPTRPKYGTRVTGYIKRQRPDGKLDLSLQKTGAEGKAELTDKILAMLQEQDGVITITDKSAPELISKIFGVSKKKYKAALGQLYKERKISIMPDRILLEDN